MNKIYLSIIAFVLPLLTFGQISLNSSLAPPVNTLIIYYDANVPSPPFTFSTSGTTNTWDFTSITADPNGDDSAYYVDPAGLAGGSAFPTSTHASYENGDASYTVISVNNDSASYLGFITDPFGSGSLVALHANPPVASMIFPYTYNSSSVRNTFIDIYATGNDFGQPSLDSVRLKTSVQFDAMAIAAGTIILPSGSYSCILERRINVDNDSTWIKGAITLNQWALAPGSPTTETDSAFYWYSDQSLAHYAHALYDNTGLHDVHFFKSQLSTGIKNLSEQSSVNVFPNPVSDNLRIDGKELQNVKDWSIIDVNGNEVLNGNSIMKSINTQQISGGTYILRLTSKDGSIRNLKFIKN